MVRKTKVKDGQGYDTNIYVTKAEARNSRNQGTEKKIYFLGWEMCEVGIVQGGIGWGERCPGQEFSGIGLAVQEMSGFGIVGVGIVWVGFLWGGNR